MSQTICKIELINRLAASASSVERDIAAMLKGIVNGDSAHRMYRYHCKIDIAHRLMQAYDDQIEKATSDRSVSPTGYLGLAHVFAAAASAVQCDGEEAYALRLLWLNSAFNSLDRLAPDHRDNEFAFEADLVQLLQEGCVA